MRWDLNQVVCQFSRSENSLTNLTLRLLPIASHGFWVIEEANLLVDVTLRVLIKLKALLLAKLVISPWCVSVD